MRIRQLGLACLIFPGATHSRLSHSLGVLYQVQQFLKGFKRQKQEVFSEQEAAELRMAAILHDVGHFPMSHLGETATAEYTSKDKQSVVVINGKQPRVSSPEHIHEELSALVVKNDKYIKEIIPVEAQRERIAAIITGSSINAACNAILHSEFDADRLDYLLRDAHFTGVNFGRIESEALTSYVTAVQETSNKSWVVGVRESALHDLEHYLLARYFFKAHILGHPGRQLVDRMSMDVYKELLNRDELPTYDKVCKWVKGGTESGRHKFYSFTDDTFISGTRKLHEKLSRSKKQRYKYLDIAVRILMDGKVPKPITRRRSREDRENWEGRRDVITDRLDRAFMDISREYKFDQEAIVYVMRDVTAGYSATVPASRAVSETGAEKIKNEFLETAKIVCNGRTQGRGSICSISEHDASILGELGDKVLVSFAVFLLEEHKTLRSKRENTKRKIENVIREKVDNAFK